MFDLKTKFKSLKYSAIAEDVILDFDTRQLTSEAYQEFIQQLPQILDQANELGTFEYGIFKITIRNLSNKKDMIQPWFKNVF
jgi:hypothetical protein